MRTTTLNHHTSSFAVREWSVFTDYLDVGDLTLPQVDLDLLAAYLRTRGGNEATTRKRAAALLLALAEHEIVLLPERPRSRTVLHEDSPGRTPAEILTDLPVLGWPHGFPMRRDAALIVLLGLMGLSRAQVRSLRPADLVMVEIVRPGDFAPTLSWSIHGTPVPFDIAPATCGQCQVSLWLGVWSAWLSGFRGGVERWLIDQQTYWGHSCDDIESVVGIAWQHEPVLFPGIDRHNWPQMETLSARQISRIVHRLQTEPRFLEPRREVPEAPRPVSASFGKRPDPDPEGRIAALLDQLDEATDEVMARVKGVLAAVGE